MKVRVKIFLINAYYIYASYIYFCIDYLEFKWKKGQ